VIGLAAAVVTASLLGSLHCVGMCGPLALWASGAGRDLGRWTVWSRLASYHLGRLLTYTIAGLAAGIAGTLVSSGGDAIGLQSLAARLVGGAMIAMGIVRLTEFLLPSLMNRPKSDVSGQPDRSSGRIARWLGRQRSWIQRLPGIARGFVAGSLTTLLPCGWLYVFVLVAAGTGGVTTALLVMFAFWLGTLPALTALVAGSLGVAVRLRPVLPVVGGTMLLVSGWYTATGRAAADLRPLERRARALQTAGTADSATLDSMAAEPLPCCIDP
jgi:sulfite exporter TauE/SafE